MKILSWTFAAAWRQVVRAESAGQEAIGGAGGGVVAARGLATACR